MARNTERGLKSKRCFFRSLVWFLGVFVTLTFVAFAQTPSVERMPPPAWVEPITPDLDAPTPKEYAGDATYTLLSEVQENAGEGTCYQHYASRVLTSSGVQAFGNVTLSFDPAYETLTIHKLMVHRDGQAIDRLEQQEIKILQREKKLERHLYDGSMSAVMLLEDIRVGDTIEWAYSRKGANPIFGGRLTQSIGMGRTLPYHRIRYRLLWPKERKLAYKLFGESVEPAILENGSLAIYTWERKQTAPIVSEGNLPEWFFPYCRLQLSEFQSWQEVVQWALKIYEVADNLPDDLNKEIETIAAQPDKKAQAVAALRFVQKNIRYLALQGGINGYKPFPVETVWKRRFGDCKDKSLVLCAILRRLGIEAFPALVSDNLRQGLAEMLPSATIFDHLVVNMRLDGQTYWLDPTRGNQGGSLENLFFPDFGKALIISDETTSLVDIIPGGFDATSVEVTRKYTPGEQFGEMNLSVRTVFRGFEADMVRSTLESTSRSVIEKKLVNFYAYYHPEISSLRSPTYIDDLEKNELTSEEHYRISNFWRSKAFEDDKLYGEFRACALLACFVQPRTRVRSMPLRLTRPCKVTENVHITFPSATLFSEQNITVEDPAFTFALVSSLSANSVNLNWQYKTTASFVEASRSAEYLDKLSKASRATMYVVGPLSKPMVDQIYGKAPYDAETWKTPAVKAAEAKRRAYRSALISALFMVLTLTALVWIAVRWFSHVRVLMSGRPRHRCKSCGNTEKTVPALQFHTASDGNEYCQQHLPE